MKSRLIAVAAIVSFAALSAQPVVAQDATPGENLGGYDSLASAMAFSFQPFLPGFVSTGDVPFEGSVALSSSRVKSGGNAFGRGALVWPGSAAANLGPILGVAFGQPEFGALIPPWPLVAESTQDDGETTTGQPPIVAMRSVGHPDRAEGDTRIADVHVPRLVHIEHIASTSSSVVTDTGVTSIARVTLSGVSLLAGHVKAEQIRSVSRTTSIGGAASSSGDVDIIGLKIGGVDVSVTDEGFHVTGLPPDADEMPGAGDEPAPGESPEDTVNRILDRLGARLTLFKSISTTRGGQAERMQPGVVVSLDNPVGGHGPIPPGRFDIVLAATSASAFGTLPFAASLRTGSDDAGHSPIVASSGPVAASIGGGPDIERGTVGRIGDRLAEVASGSLSAPPVLDAIPRRNEYRFGGLPVGLVLGLLALAALAARYIRGYLASLMQSTVRTGGDAS